MQKQLSSFDIYVIIEELKELIDNHIEKIYQISRGEILIKVKNIQTKKKTNFYIKNGSFLCLTNKDFEKPMKPPVFAMALRKYLSNGKISSIKQHEFDRIIIINIMKNKEEYSLIIEFFSDGNIILVNPQGKIIVPLIRQSWAHRKISGRQEYIFPPSQINPFELTKEKFGMILKESNTDIVRTLAVSVNLSGPIAEEICTRAGTNKNIKIKEIDEKIISDIYEGLKKFLNIFQEKKFKPVIVKKDNKIIDVLPFKFQSYKDFTFEETKSFLKSFDLFINEKTEPKKTKKEKSDDIVEKLNRQLKMQKDAVIRLRKEIKNKKIIGDIIYIHYQEIEELLKNINLVLEKKDKKQDIKKINDLDIVKEFNPEKNLLILNLKDTIGNIIDIKISFRKSVSENAEKAYDDNKKLKSKLSGAKKSIEKTLEQIKKVEEKNKNKKKEIKEKTKTKEKTFWFERFRWFISSNGNIVIGGKDAKTNEIIVKKYLKEGDRYSHAEVQGAPSIIIKSQDALGNKKEIDEKTLEESCIFAASFSKAWKQFAETQAYWVLPEQVSKTAQSGEFIPRGAFIIRGKRNYYNCKFELAIGQIKIQDSLKIMCGPVSSVKTHCKKYIVFQPGDVKKIEYVKKIAKVFDVDTYIIDRAIPAGGATTTETIGFDMR